MHYCTAVLIPPSDDHSLIFSRVEDTLEPHRYYRFDYKSVGGRYDGWFSSKRDHCGCGLESNMMKVDDLLAQGDKMVVPNCIATHHGLFFSEHDFTSLGGNQDHCQFTIVEEWDDFVRQVYRAYSGSLAVCCDLHHGDLLVDWELEAISKNSERYWEHFQEHTSACQDDPDPTDYPPPVINVRVRAYYIPPNLPAFLFDGICWGRRCQRCLYTKGDNPSQGAVCGSCTTTTEDQDA